MLENVWKKIRKIFVKLLEKIRKTFGKIREYFRKFVKYTALLSSGQSRQEENHTKEETRDAVSV